MLRLRTPYYWPALALLYLLIAAGWTWTRTEPNRDALAETVAPFERLHPGSAACRALQDSAFWWTQSVQAANDAYDEQCAALKAWDPAAVPANHATEIRRLLASDPDGYLLRARRAAARAVRLARTPVDRQRAVRQRVRLERAAGRPEIGPGIGENAGGRRAPWSREPPVRRLE